MKSNTTQHNGEGIHMLKKQTFFLKIFLIFIFLFSGSISSANAIRHKVKNGETLTLIMKKHNLKITLGPNGTVQSIIKNNNLKNNGNSLQVGQILLLDPSVKKQNFSNGLPLKQINTNENLYSNELHSPSSHREMITFEDAPLVSESTDQDLEPIAPHADELESVAVIPEYSAHHSKPTLNERRILFLTSYSDMQFNKIDEEFKNGASVLGIGLILPLNLNWEIRGIIEFINQIQNTLQIENTTALLYRADLINQIGSDSIRFIWGFGLSFLNYNIRKKTEPSDENSSFIQYQKLKQGHSIGLIPQLGFRFDLNSTLSLDLILEYLYFNEKDIEELTSISGGLGFNIQW